MEQHRRRSADLSQCGYMLKVAIYALSRPCWDTLILPPHSVASALADEANDTDLD
jgi:hypothetical protein